MWKYWAGGIGVIILGIVIGMLVPENLENELLSPLGWRKWIDKPEEKKMEVIGFLPTWMIGKTKYYGSEITQLVFSGIEVTAEGKLVWDVQSRKINNQNYLELKDKIKRNGGKNIVSIKMFADKDLEAFIANPEARLNLIQEVAGLVKDNGFGGVNIDFEYMSNPVRIMSDDFLSFFAEARQGGWGEVGIDVFANTIIKGSGERIGKMLESVDWVVVMAYDFHRPGSDYSGPVAPIAAPPGQRSIGEIADKLVASNLSSKKIILALPLYGYEWATVDDSFGSAQLNGRYGRTIFYAEGIGFTGVKWGEDSLSPWITWQESVKKSRVISTKVGKRVVKKTEYYYVNEWHSAHFENERSLEAKVDLAVNSQMGGIGFWALGYEGVESELINNLSSRLIK